MLYREPKLLKANCRSLLTAHQPRVSVLYREPKLLKDDEAYYIDIRGLHVSVLYREPKLLKVVEQKQMNEPVSRFSALP